jgi:hypothetical protein
MPASYRPSGQVNISFANSTARVWLRSYTIDLGIELSIGIVLLVFTLVRQEIIRDL